MRLIDADALKEIAHEMIEEDPEAFNGGYSYDAVTVGEIDDAPTIDAVPVVHGEWVDNGIPESMLSRCSVCSYGCGAYSFNFCPNCGADMWKGGSVDVK